MLKTAKNLKIIFVLIVIFIVAGFIFKDLNFSSLIKQVDVKAAATDNVLGFAWSENIGWISFNAVNCDTDSNGFIDTDIMVQGCGGDNITDIVFDYGVNIDSENGNFSGYGWSSNIGWISFEQGEATPDGFAFSANCDDPAACDDIGDGCTACYNSTNKNVYGWAKILSLGGDGWLKMSDDSIAAWSGNGVSIDAITGEFSGWAWNANNTGAGIGWVSFNCDDEGVCASSDYKVRVILSIAEPVITSITPLVNFQCEKLVVSWNDVNGELGYRVFRDDFSPPTTQVSVDLNPDTASFTDSSLLAGVTYYYIVQAFNGFGFSNSDVAGGATYSICAVSNVEAAGVCPNTIELDWQSDANADHYEIERCNETNLECTNESFSGFVSGDDCFEPLLNSCVDDTILNPAEVRDYFQYRVRAVSAISEYGDWSDLSDKMQACMGVPTWKEVGP